MGSSTRHSPPEHPPGQFPKAAPGVFGKRRQVLEVFHELPQRALDFLYTFHLGPHQRVQMTGSGD